MNLFHYFDFRSQSPGRGAGRARSVDSPLARPSRARSASPAVMESTLTAVQAALNKRQLQVFIRFFIKKMIG